MLYYWGIVVPKKELSILEQDSNHIVFNVNNVFTGLKSAPQYNVTYEDYLTFYNVTFKTIADYVGANYNQETTTDGVKVTITKK